MPSTRNKQLAQDRTGCPPAWPTVHRCLNTEFPTSQGDTIPNMEGHQSCASLAIPGGPKKLTNLIFMLVKPFKEYVTVDGIHHDNTHVIIY